jgi:hypothetical protein
VSLRRRAAAIAMALAVAHCSTGAEPPWLAAANGSGSPAPAGSGGRGLLFIGNSLTQANDLPRRVQEIAGDGGSVIDVDMVATPGYSLEDHLGAGAAAARIRARPWATVVLQQGPSTLPESRAALIRDLSSFAAQIRAAGARPALLMVWPLPGQLQEDVSASHRAAADATGALLVPAGDAWQAARARDASLRFTGADGFHPSRLGTYLAALSVHCALNGSLPPAPALAIERQRAGVELSEAQSALLRQVACAAR